MIYLPAANVMVVAASGSLNYEKPVTGNISTLHSPLSTLISNLLPVDNRRKLFVDEQCYHNAYHTLNKSERQVEHEQALNEVFNRRADSLIHSDYSVHRHKCGVNRINDKVV